MTIKQIRKLAVASFKGNELDEKKTQRIVKLLSRTDLKNYIKVIKNINRQSKITVFTANISEKSNIINQLKANFVNKKIELEEDKSLIGGIKIVDNDIIYDFNIQTTLKNLVSYINN